MFMIPVLPMIANLSKVEPYSSTHGQPPLLGLQIFTPLL